MTKEIRSEKKDLRKLGISLKRDTDRAMGWVLVMKLITYINDDEKRLLEQTIAKVKENNFLNQETKFMNRLENLSKKDIKYLEEFKRKIKP